MQVLKEQAKSLNEKVSQETTPALPFRDDLEDILNPKPVAAKEEVKEVIPERMSKRETREARNKFLGRDKSKSPESSPKENFQDLTENEIINDVHVEHDGRRLMRWMSSDLEKIREYIAFCRKPPYSDDPEENRQIKKQIAKYMEFTLFNDADTIVDYIEGLEFHGLVNHNLFGEHNYLLDETIDGYKTVYDELIALKNKEKPDEALRLLNKLVIIALRPLIEDAMLSKGKILEQSIVASSVKV